MANETKTFCDGCGADADDCECPAEDTTLDPVECGGGLAIGPPEII